MKKVDYLRGVALVASGAEAEGSVECFGRDWISNVLHLSTGVVTDVVVEPMEQCGVSTACGCVVAVVTIRPG